LPHYRGRTPVRDSPRSAAAAHTPSAHPSRGAYVVRSGDTLWAVAAELLGADASDAQVAAEVRRLFRLNTGVLASPDALVPGVQLQLS
jgi:Tfp pilus assembly protein FimV